MKNFKNIRLLLNVSLLSLFFVFLTSCGGDDNEVQPINPPVKEDTIPGKQPKTYTEESILADLEGMYIGEYVNTSNYNIKKTGNVYIKKMSNGLYSVEGMCDEFGLSIKTDGWRVNVSEYNNVPYQVAFSKMSNRPTSGEYWEIDEGFMWLSDMKMNFRFRHFPSGSSSWDKVFNFIGTKKQ
jgi:hypothetical protein